MRDRRTTLEQPLMCLNQITLQKALTLFKYVTLDTVHKLKNTITWSNPPKWALGLYEQFKILNSHKM